MAEHQRCPRSRGLRLTFHPRRARRAQAGTHPGGRIGGLTGMAPVSQINPRRAEIALSGRDALVPTAAGTAGPGTQGRRKPGAQCGEPDSRAPRPNAAGDRKSPTPGALLPQMWRRMAPRPQSAPSEQTQHTAKETRNPTIRWCLCRFKNAALETNLNSPSGVHLPPQRAALLYGEKPSHLRPSLAEAGPFGVPGCVSPGCWGVGGNHIPASWSHGPGDEAATAQGGAHVAFGTQAGGGGGGSQRADAGAQS